MVETVFYETVVETVFYETRVETVFIDAMVETVFHKTVVEVVIYKTMVETVFYETTIETASLMKFPKCFCLNVRNIAVIENKDMFFSTRGKSCICLLFIFFLRYL